VASLGTAFTAEQADELRKYADRIILCYDGDAAGNAAALRAIDIAATKIERAGASLRICVLPAGEDPDSFVRAHGRAPFEGLLAEAVPAVQFKLDPRIARLATGFENPAAIAREAEEIVRRLVPREEWDRWRTYVAMRLGLAVDDLRAAARVDAIAGFARPVEAGLGGTRRAGARIGAPSSERELLAIFIERPELIALFADAIAPDEFRDERYRRILLTLFERGRDAESSGELFSLFIEDAELLEIVAALGQADRSPTPRYPGIEDAKAHVRRILTHFERERERRRLDELNREVDSLLEAGDPIPDALRQELAALTKRLQA
ncbi:MAG: toprim domain-containing protein, partial [Candidatus Eremiobacteraeota bacterium]|nr:toprim domain-containing protein [Candidatus Eremiobacteraeota bacterium]